MGIFFVHSAKRGQALKLDEKRWLLFCILVPPRGVHGGLRSESVQDNQVPALTGLARVKRQGMTLNFDLSCLNEVFSQSIATKSIWSSWLKCHLETVVKIPINLV